MFWSKPKYSIKVNGVEVGKPEKSKGGSKVSWDWFGRRVFYLGLLACGATLVKGLLFS